GPLLGANMSSLTTQRARTAGLHRGWIVMLAGFLVGTVAYGVYFSFGIFYPPIIAEFGWSRGVVSGAFSISLATYSIFAVPMGFLVDRFGPRVAVVVGGIFFGAGTWLGSWVSEPWHLYVLYGVITAFGMGAAYVPIVSTVARWFVRRRGLAVGLASLGSGAGTFLVTPLIAQLIATVGWRQAYAVAGVAAGLLIAAGGLFLWRDPAELGLKPYGFEDQPSVRTAGPGGYIPVNRAVRSSAFWRLTLMFCAWWFASLIVVVLGADYALSQGADAATAALLLTVIGLGSSLGKVFWGSIGDRIGPRPAYFLATYLELMMYVALIFTRHPVILVGVAAVFAFGYGGGSPAFPSLTAELFGSRSLGLIFGLLFAAVGFAGAFGPVLGGFLYDRTGSYGPGLTAGAVALVVSLVLCRLLPPARFAT
ncbi:MAG TPA: MFS transporter, partial [Dehalococcoidia bacterium]|nr:MFS transporter [Dehalococcoidia bacterium]